MNSIKKVQWIKSQPLPNSRVNRFLQRDKSSTSADEHRAVQLKAPSESVKYLHGLMILYSTSFSKVKSKVLYIRSYNSEKFNKPPHYNKDYLLQLS